MNKGYFAGRVAKAPTLRQGVSTTVCYFTLIKDEYVGKDNNGDTLTRKVALDFTAFGGQADVLANQRPGDQLMIEYSIQNNEKVVNDQTVYGLQLVVQDFEFGAPGKATREHLAAQRQGGRG